MSSVYFYRRKYDKEVVNCWFSVRDGEKLISLDACNVGDDVVLVWDIDGDMAAAIGNMEQDNFRAFSSGISNKDWSVHIPLTVVKKRLMLSEPTPTDRFTLRFFGYDIFVKAINGLWEDVLLWVLLGEVPQWAKEAQDI